MKKIKIILSICFTALVIGVGCVLTLSANADSPVFDEAYFKKRTSVANLYKCYNGYMNSPITIGDKGTFNGKSSLGKSESGGIAAVPTNFYKDLSTISCLELFAGNTKNGYPGVLSGTTVPDLNSGSLQQGEFLTKLGYKASGSQGVQCGRVTYDIKLTLGEPTVMEAGQPAQPAGTYNYGTYYSPEFCADVDANGNTITGKLSLGEDAEGVDSQYEQPLVCGMDNSGVGCASSGGGSGTTSMVCKAGVNFENECLKKYIFNALPEVSNTHFAGWPTVPNSWMYTRVGTSTSARSTEVGGTYTLDSNSGNTAAQNLFGMTGSTFTVAERISLYQIYLNHDANSMYCSVPDDKKSEVLGSAYIDKPVHLVKDGKVYSNCYVSASEKEYVGFDGANWFKMVSLDEILDFLASNQADSTWAVDIVSANARIYDEDNPGGIQPGYDPTAPDSNEVDCYNAAGALGWILCPVIDFAQHTITAIYDSIVQNFLEFRAEFLDINGKGASVYAAWQTFQSIANVGFVIVLLIVIFSQLTGIGIDNLGIKRILPKLIIAAILINLSYLICMLFVDMSNILGVGLNNLFSNIIVSIDNTSGATGAAVLSTVITGAVVAAVGFLSVGAVVAGISGGVIVLPLVLGLIGTLVGVLFFFILLGLRQALIIMLIVVSPVAVACYMLPNTKSIFNKWLKLFEALLLLFPICGLIMGGSAFASKILMSMDVGFLGKLIAMLVGVVPFFFIPTLLKGSMAVAGNIGGKISGLGQSLSRGARGRVANSQWMKDYQTRSAAGINSKGKQTALGRWRSNVASGNSRFSRVPGMQTMASRAQARGLINYEKMRDELDFASRPDLITSEAVARRFSRQQAAEDARLVSSGDVNRTGDIKDSELTSADDFEEGALTYDYMQAVRSGNEAAQYAIIERMLANGHHGAQSYRNVLKVLEQEGNTKALETAARAGKNSRHVGDLKGGARSVFDYINGVTNGDVIDASGNIKAGNTLDDYIGKTKFSNMSEAQLFNTDNEELSRWLTYVNQKRSAIDTATTQKEQELGRTLTAEEKNEVYASQFSSAKEQEQYEALISQAQKAYNNPRLRGQAKESRQNLVADIAGISQGQRTSQSINIPREDNSGNSRTSGNSQGAGGEGGKAVNGGSPSPSEDSSAINIDHSDSDNSTKQITGEQLQQMARQYNNQSGPTGRGNVSDEDLQRNIARLQRKQNPTLQESEMLNALYNEQGVRANIREANRDGQNNNQA